MPKIGKKSFSIKWDGNLNMVFDEDLVDSAKLAIDKESGLAK